MENTFNLRNMLTSLAIVVFICVALLTGAAWSSAKTSCIPGALLNRAVLLYETGRYTESSTAYEHSAYDYENCAERKQIETPTVRDSIALLLMIAGEAAHWAHEPTRARSLAHLARSRFEKIIPFAKSDSDLDFSLTGHIEEVDGDLAGRWTLGIPK